jgi:hypothetical protein
MQEYEISLNSAGYPHRNRKLTGDRIAGRDDITNFYDG